MTAYVIFSIVCYLALIVATVLACWDLRRDARRRGWKP